jgi:hypothetical protein
MGAESMRRTAVLIFLAVVLAACQAAIKPDSSALSLNHALFDQIRTGQDQAVLAQLPAEAKKDEMAAMMARLKTVIPTAAPSSITPVSETVATGKGGRENLLMVDYDFADRTIRFATRLAQPAGATGWRLASFSLLEASHQELAANALSLARRSPAQLIFFALAITSPILMLAALVKVLRTPGLTYRWLWAGFAFVGLFSFKINWASGAVLVQWLDLQIVGFWMAKGPSPHFDPWIISATVPIGALLILAGLAAQGPKAAKA